MKLKDLIETINSEIELYHQCEEEPIAVVGFFYRYNEGLIHYLDYEVIGIAAGTRQGRDILEITVKEVS